jgi:hypothetical protein
MPTTYSPTALVDHCKQRICSGGGRRSALQGNLMLHFLNSLWAFSYKYNGSRHRCLSRLANLMTHQSSSIHYGDHPVPKLQPFDSSAREWHLEF